MEYSLLADIEHGAITRSQGEGLKFLVQSQELTDQGFAVRRNFDSNGGAHRTSLFVKRALPLLPKPRHHHQRS
jgi:hypothetical protein